MRSVSPTSAPGSGVSRGAHSDACRSMEAQLFSRCARSGLVIGEIPISYGCRSEDATKLRGLSSGMAILLALLKERFKSKRSLKSGAAHKRAETGTHVLVSSAELRCPDGKPDTDL